MKKIFSIFALSILLLGMNACTSDADDNMTRQITGNLLTNSVSIEDGQSVRTSISSANMTWNITESTITLTFSAEITSSNAVTVNLQNVPIEANETYNCYTFTATNGGNGITNVHGYYRPETGCLYIDFIANATHRVMCASQLYYPYARIDITNTENSKVKENDNSAMLVTINPKTMTAQVAMGGFSFEESTGMIQDMAFSGLPVVATSTGYKVTCSDNTYSSEGTYVLNNLDLNVTGSGQVINGTFTVNTKYNGSFAGKAFAN